MTSNDMLSGSPYLLTLSSGPILLADSRKLAEDVTLLRRQGSLDDRTLESLRREWGMEQVYESAGIEGNQLTLNETRIAIVRGITITGKPPEHTEEVVRLHQAHEHLETLLRESGPITKRQLMDVHTLVLGRGSTGAGTYRTIEVQIGDQVHKPPHPAKVPEEMDAYFAWLATADACPIPLRAAVAHAWLAHIHPFVDGNGRTARAAMNLLLMRTGFPVAVIRRKDRQRYYDALAKSDEGDIGPLLELIVARSRDSLRQIDRVRTQVTGVTIEMERIAAKDETMAAVWNASCDLLCQELALAFERVVDKDPSFRFSWRRYDPIDSTDYQRLCGGQSVSESWLARYRLTRHDRSFEMLLWAGFSTPAMKGLARAPSVFVSESNPEGYPQWRPATPSFPTGLREILYAEGKFHVRTLTGVVTIESSPTAMALACVSEVLRNAF